MHRDALLSWAVVLGVFCMPPLSCASAWWFSLRGSPNLAVSHWRHTTTRIGLLLATSSISFGTFALVYWLRYPGAYPGPPLPTFVTTYVGAALALLSLPCSLSATSWNRVALVLCSVGLLGFYHMMFLSP